MIYPIGSTAALKKVELSLRKFWSQSAQARRQFSWSFRSLAPGQPSKPFAMSEHDAGGSGASDCIPVQAGKFPFVLHATVAK